MSTSSISGLGSGLDTAGIVSQLMQLEAVQQNKLKSRVTAEKSNVQVMQNLNARVAALATAATDLGKAEAWSSVGATSSHEGVSVNATAGASVSSLAVSVQKLASSHGETYTQTAALTDVLVPVDATTGKRMLTIAHQDGRTLTIDTGDGTLRGMVDALNASGSDSGVRANVLQVSPGVHRLVVDSTATGADSSFEITVGGAGLLGGAEASRTRSGSDAEISVSGFTITSKSNTFTDVMPGVSLTLNSKAEIGESVDIAITRDAAKQSAAVKAFVNDINALLTEIDSRTAYNAATNTAGVLSGDSGIRALRDTLASAIFPGDGSTMTEVGVDIDRNGKLVFDETAFAAAFAANPGRVAQVLGTENGGFAERVKTISEQASDKNTGSLTSAIQGRNDGITRLNQSIESWDLRLELRHTTLSRQFSALDVALSKMNSQSSWLASQISSLPSTS